jgi:hypothetical protein
MNFNLKVRRPPKIKKLVSVTLNRLMQMKQEEVNLIREK